MTTLISDSSTPLARLNIFDDPAPWNQVRVAGILVLATAKTFNGLKVEDVWKMQKSKNASGAVFSFNGTNPVGGESGFSIAFRVTTREQFDQLYDIYDALKPLPVAGGGSSGTSSNGTSTKAATFAVGSPPKPDDSSSAESALAQAQAALASLNSPKPAASSKDAADQQTAATTPQPSPGPRPPTLPIELGWLAFLGVFAIARKSWEFSVVEQSETDAAHIEVTIGFIHDKPPVAAGAGAMSATTKSTSSTTTSPWKQAKSGAAGT